MKHKYIYFSQKEKRIIFIHRIFDKLKPVIHIGRELVQELSVSSLPFSVHLLPTKDGMSDMTALEKNSFVYTAGLVLSARGRLHFYSVLTVCFNASTNFQEPSRKAKEKAIFKLSSLSSLRELFLRATKENN